MYRSCFGGLVIDTPGMRELQLLDQEEGLAVQFADIEELFVRCKFTNCQHQAEPGCAVLKEIELGNLSIERWQSYGKMQKEIRHVQRKQDKTAAAADKKVTKKRSSEAKWSKKDWKK